MTSGKSIGRLSHYRRLLLGLIAEGQRNIYSHELAALARGTAAQVRRDIMGVGYIGSPSRGYDVHELAASLGDFLDAPEGQRAALVGVGNVGRAILSYFAGRRPKLTIDAAFDDDHAKVGRVIHGCRCHHIKDMNKVVRNEKIDIGIVTVPRQHAQDIADRLCHAGVHGLVNFAPTRLVVPEGVFVEDVDIAVAIEKVAYFARKRAGAPERDV